MASHNHPTQDSSSSSPIDVNTVMGKNFSVERYYMLSEIEQHALRPVYLNDYYFPDNNTNSSNNTNNTNNTNTSDTNSEIGGEGETVATVTSETENYRCDLPPFIILYLLWNCNRNSNSNKGSSERLSAEEEAESFQEGPLKNALFKLQSLSERIEQSREKEDGEIEGNYKEPSPLLPKNVYVVVDVLLWSSDNESDNDNDNDNGSNESKEEGGSSNINNGEREDRFRRQLDVVEALAKRILLTSNNSNSNTNSNTSSTNQGITVSLSGATVGLADHARAAPGLESCLQAIMVGGRDRRRHGRSNNGETPKSCVGIVCHSLEDLVGYDEETETDAVQGLMQSLTHAAFANRENAGIKSNSNSSPQSPILDYAHNAHVHWRVEKAGLPAEPTPEEQKAHEGYGSDKNSNAWVLAILVLLAAFWWKNK